MVEILLFLAVVALVACAYWKVFGRWPLTRDRVDNREHNSRLDSRIPDPPPRGESSRPVSARVEVSPASRISHSSYTAPIDPLDTLIPLNAIYAVPTADYSPSAAHHCDRNSGGTESYSSGSDSGSSASCSDSGSSSSSSD